MKHSVLLLAAIVLCAGSLWVFHRCGEFLADGAYVAGVLYMTVGFVIVRAGVELARLSVAHRGGRHPR